MARAQRAEVFVDDSPPGDHSDGLRAPFDTRFDHPHDTVVETDIQPVPRPSGWGDEGDVLGGSGKASQEGVAASGPPDAPAERASKDAAVPGDDAGGACQDAAVSAGDVSAAEGAVDAPAGEGRAAEEAADAPAGGGHAADAAAGEERARG
eukprot:453543-Pyramimonas_sp.AAC.1